LNDTVHFAVQQAVDPSSLVALRQMQPPGKPDAVARIITRFLEESTERVTALRLAAQVSDPVALETAAHALKGSAGTVGANEMLQLAVRLERIGREGHTDGAASLVAELEAAFGRAWPIFDRLRNVP
jgi:HPt (histidine-containing phosphotransfer) domain-containing protein